MKKVLLIALAICMAFAGVAFATVAGSYHDLGTGGGDVAGTGSDQVCVFCHHPHRGTGTDTLTDALLWNITAGDTAASYAVYTPTSSGSTTMNAADGAAIDVSTGVSSYVCMSCHDGGVGDNALVRTPRDATANTTAFTFNNAAADLGTTLEDDHPVNFTYDDAEGEIQPSNAGADVTGDVSSNTYPLFAGTMQCATCHDVHAGGLGAAPLCDGTDGLSCDSNIEFMLGDTAASEICIDCHLNK